MILILQQFVNHDAKTVVNVLALTHAIVKTTPMEKSVINASIKSNNEFLKNDQRNISKKTFYIYQSVRC